MKRQARIFVLAGAVVTGQVQADCPPMSVYRVTNVSADTMPIGEAMDLLFAGTAWKADVRGPAEKVTVSFRGVSGPLDQVVSKLVEGASRASTALSAVTDPSRCVATVNVIQPTAITAGTTAAAVVPASSKVSALPQQLPEILPAGKTLEEALAVYVKRHGWQLRWLLDEQYVLDAPLPIPPMDVIDGVTYVVRAYQARGGMRGVVPEFNRGNNVVVINKMDVREQNQ